jgi:hypothetical protein
MQNAKCRISHTKVGNAECRMQNTECRIMVEKLRFSSINDNSHQKFLKFLETFFKKFLSGFSGQSPE